VLHVRFEERQEAVLYTVLDHIQVNPENGVGLMGTDKYHDLPWVRRPRRTMNLKEDHIT
jgi:hypothetical protein